MTAVEIVKEIKKLSLSDQMLIIENAIKGIRKKATAKSDIATAAKLLLNDYLTDKELTVLTVLDSEDFYETR